MKKLLSLIALTLITCILLCGCVELPTNQGDVLTTEHISEDDTGLTLHFIDVGQGDCTLLESKGRYALIDAGEYSERDKVISYLSNEGVESLDFIISTHPHSDHCGGLSEVIRNFDTSVFISPDADSDSSSWEYVLDAADERGVTYETPEIYDTYELGSATITVLSPSTDSVYSNLNDYSIVTMVEYGNTSVLLTGDAEKTVEKELLRSGYDLSADVLKCGHHGSSTSSCEDFLDAVSPAAAIVSCGKDNDYGHPHEEVVEALSERNISIWRTDISGNIVVSSDGEQISISTSETATIVDKNDTATQNLNSQTSTYIGNKNSKVFHSVNCDSVDKMSDKNKINFQNRNDAVDAGYSPCGSCEP